MTARRAVCWALMAVACSQPAKEPEGERGASSSTRAGQPVPDGVLASATGRGGVAIRVEQKSGRRFLYIGDTVHAAVPWTDDGPDLTAVDPVVDLVRRLRPEARTALVIGLGSGMTAGDLSRAGLQVTAVEIEPAVIEMAKSHFGYRGNAIAADGLAYMRDHKDTFDVLLMDAFAGTDPPAELVAPAAIQLMRDHTGAGGITAIRLFGSPADPTFMSIQKSLRRTRRDHFYDQVFGSGVAAEPQNLYLLASDTPISLTATSGLPLWPLITDESALGAVDGAPEQTGKTRAITVAGYVHRLDGGALALDLAHQEMGAVRYLLVGKASEKLAAALPAGARFPTEGDIGTDGNTDATLKPLFGGGGVKRCDLRFSPLVAAVSGRAGLIAVVHPDAASKVPAAERGDAPTDERLPWGGALYQLDVSELHWTLDRAGWNALEAKLTPEITAATRAVDKGALDSAAEALDRYASGLAKGLGAHAELVPACRAAMRWRDQLAAEAKRAKARGHAFAIAAACDLVQYRMEDSALGPIEPVRRALFHCAVDRYESVARTDSTAYGYDAAARLLDLLDRPNASGAEQKRAGKILRAVQKKHKASPMQFPPDAVGGPASSTRPE